MTAVAVRKVSNHNMNDVTMLYPYQSPCLRSNFEKQKQIGRRESFVSLVRLRKGRANSPRTVLRQSPRQAQVPRTDVIRCCCSPTDRN